MSHVGKPFAVFSQRTWSKADKSLMHIEARPIHILYFI